MSGFSAEWLAQREAADHGARNREILGRVAAHFTAYDTLSIVDLGSGTGSNLRGCALALPALRQHWTLVDHDPQLIQAARVRLRAWANDARDDGEGLALRKDGKTITVTWRRADLAAGFEGIPDVKTDLVTAAALFDLVSPAWIGRFAVSLASRRLPLYAVLTYNGREEWIPENAGDATIHRAFLKHQRRDKGFGPSAGPDATRVLEEAFAREGYTVALGDSPWSLGAADAGLVTQLVEGIAAAAVESGEVGTEAAQAWARLRVDATLTTRGRALIGHVDLWAHS